MIEPTHTEDITRDNAPLSDERVRDWPEKQRFLFEVLTDQLDQLPAALVPARIVDTDRSKPNPELAYFMIFATAAASSAVLLTERIAQMFDDDEPALAKYLRIVGRFAHTFVGTTDGSIVTAERLCEQWCRLRGIDDLETFDDACTTPLDADERAEFALLAAAIDVFYQHAQLASGHSGRSCDAFVKLMGESIRVIDDTGGRLRDYFGWRGYHSQSALFGELNWRVSNYKKQPTLLNAQHIYERWQTARRNS